LVERFIRLLARLPMPVRRKLLRSSFHLWRGLGLLRPCGRSAWMMAKALQLPRADAWRLAGENAYHDLLFQMEWLALADRSLPGLLADAANVRTEDDETLRWISRQRGAVLATLHMGPYSLSLAWLLHRYFRDREVVIVKSRTSDRDENRAMARLEQLGVRVALMAPTESAEFHALLKRVRAGAILIALVDLPESYGRSVDTDLLWTPARIAAGAADIAALCRVPLLLFRTEAQGVRDRVTVANLLEVPSMQAQRDRAIGKVAAFITESVRGCPEQWHMWPRFDEFVAAPQRCAA
jgi:phosphatidylinositol dimannoside acyltransferase